jgi:D-beta-D-heptose 7-phosphate kinase/D-beta-D-heptose 1-phosphate adenosyltransferase
MMIHTLGKITVVERLEDFGFSLVFTNGCFDILHAGHVEYLEAAASLGTSLCVAVNSDESVRVLKGPERPVNPLQDRMRVLAALACVDYVFPFEASNVAGLLRRIKPRCWVKGGDYTLETLNKAEVEAARESDTIIKLLPLKPGYSTTQTLAKISS